MVGAQEEQLPNEEVLGHSQIKTTLRVPLDKREDVVKGHLFAAMAALEQYRYEPATIHGKPVPAHVTVTIKFLFEP